MIDGMWNEEESTTKESILITENQTPKLNGVDIAILRKRKDKVYKGINKNDREGKERVRAAP